MGTILVRPTDDLETIRQKVAQAASGDVVKFSAGEYPDVLLSELECPSGVTLRTDGATLAKEEEVEPEEELEEEEEEEEELEPEGNGEGGNGEGTEEPSTETEEE